MAAAPRLPDRSGVLIGVPTNAAARAAWRSSGAEALTQGEAASHPWRAAGFALDAAREIERHSAAMGRRMVVDGPRRLAERAAFAGWTSSGRTSVGGATRLLRARDRWVSLSIARPDDVRALPALFEVEVEVEPEVEPEHGPDAEVDGDNDPRRGERVAGDALWTEVGRLVGHRDAATVVARAALLGLSCAIAGERAGGSGQVLDQGEPGHGLGVRHVGFAGPGRRRAVPLVVDLSALWAGPLCARLLGDAGGRVVKIESATRPDGARQGNAAFYGALHGGDESVVLDFADRGDLALLHALIAESDVVITAARPRALRGLGLDIDDAMSRNPITAWVAITAFGTYAEDRVGFGDDTAVAAGLVAADPAGPTFAADAIADPLTGLAAAAAALRTLAGTTRARLDIDLASTALAASRWDGATTEDAGADEQTEEPVTAGVLADAPSAPSGPSGLPASAQRPPAPAPGAHTEPWRSRLQFAVTGASTRLTGHARHDRDHDRFRDR